MRFKVYKIGKKTSIVLKNNLFYPVNEYVTVVPVSALIFWHELCIQMGYRVRGRFLMASTQIN